MRIRKYHTQYRAWKGLNSLPDQREQACCLYSSIYEQVLIHYRHQILPTRNDRWILLLLS